MKHVRRASQPQTAEGKAFRCQPDELPGAPGQVHIEAVVVSCADICGHTRAHTHTHPEGKLLDYTLAVLILFPKSLCYGEPDSPCFGKRDD